MWLQCLHCTRKNFTDFNNQDRNDHVCLFQPKELTNLQFHNSFAINNFYYWIQQLQNYIIKIKKFPQDFNLLGKGVSSWTGTTARLGQW